jgi:hypothetical protein
MKQAAAALVIAALPVPGAAEPLVDMALLFAQNADRVVVTTNGGLTWRKLDLGDGVHTRCKGEAGHDDCVSIDINGTGGTTDCTLAHAARRLALARHCGIGTAVQRHVLESLFDDLGQQVAALAVPPRDWPALRERVLGKVARDLPQDCGRIDARSRDFLAWELRAVNLRRLWQTVQTPRLPVGKCLD